MPSTMTNPSEIAETHSIENIWQKTAIALDEIFEAKSILKHPFYVAWQRGELPQAALADYATHYYHHIAAFPTHISALHSRCDDLGTRQVLLQNLMEEEIGTDNHPELWLRFAEGIGVSRETVQATPPSAQSQGLTRTFHDLTRTQSLPAGLATLYAYERQMPAVSETKIDGLQRFYGIDDAQSLAYFRVHADVDIRHSEEARQLLMTHVTTEQDSQDTVRGAGEIADALWDLLTEIAQRHNIAPTEEGAIASE